MAHVGCWVFKFQFQFKLKLNANRKRQMPTQTQRQGPRTRKPTHAPDDTAVAIIYRCLIVMVRPILPTLRFFYFNFSKKTKAASAQFEVCFGVGVECCMLPLFLCVVCVRYCCCQRFVCFCFCLCFCFVLCFVSVFIVVIIIVSWYFF